MLRPIPRLPLLLIAPLAMVACRRVEDRPPPPAAAVEEAPSEWPVSELGIGTLKIGMTADEAQSAVHGTFVAEPMVPDGGCNYALWPDAPAGVGVLLDSVRVVRIDVKTGPVATTEGARIGDREDRIQTLYKGRVTVTPQKYTAGHYLTVTPAAPEDSLLRIVFETDGQIVKAFRAGILPAVEYVEGCG